MVTKKPKDKTFSDILGNVIIFFFRIDVFIPSLQHMYISLEKFPVIAHMTHVLNTLGGVLSWSYALI